MSFAIVADDLGFAWPGGEVVFQQLSFVVGPGRTGLIGANGSGKSTLLRLVAGELSPTGGSVRVEGSLGYLRQDLTLDAGLPVDEVLGIARGPPGPGRHRAGRGHRGPLRRRPGRTGTSRSAPGRPSTAWGWAISTWTGASARCRAARPSCSAWPPSSCAGPTCSCWTSRPTTWTWTPAAAADVQRQQRELRDARVKLDRRRRYGQKMWDTRREPKIIMGARKRQAQVSAGKHRGMHTEGLEEARQRLSEATRAVHDDDEIRVDLPGTAVPAGRTVLTVHQACLRGGARVELEVRGPERVALLGPDGAGKTTLLETVVGTLEPLAGTVAAAVPLRYLPQRLDVLDEAAGVAANLARFAPAPPTTPSGPAWPGSCSAATGPTSRWAPCRAASGSGPPWPPCSWPSRHPSCCCWTSRPTTWTWPAAASRPRPWPPTGAPCWWPATPAVPALHRHHPLAAPGGPADRDRPALTGLRTLSGRAGVMVMSRAELLLAQMDEVYARLRGRLEGLTDDEYLWEPVPGCWTVHRDPSGAWVTDYAEPDPDPAPFTTIGWRLVHLADCKVVYHEWAFGERRLRFPDLAAPASAAAALARLEEGQGRLRAALAALGEDELDGPCWTNWGERWPAWRILWTMIDHDAHHGAEIGCLRDLYRATAAGG